MPKLPPLPLSVNDLKNLHDSGLTDRTIRANGLYTESDSGKLAKFLNCGRNAKQCQCEGLVFRYRNLDGEFTGFARVRPSDPREREGKLVKYEQPRDTPLQAYFPKESVKHLRDESRPIFVTEGEKKALALSQTDVAAIGIGGVDGWGKDGKLIEDLSEINWSGRNVYVVFDYDEKEITRRNVRSAERRFANALREAGANEVYCVELPSSEDGGKQGVDDFLVVHGKAAFLELIDEAMPVESMFSDRRNSSIDLITLTPPQLDEAAYHGFVGEFIRAVSPYTEATDAGILGHLLPAIGVSFGPAPHVFGGDEQPARINTVLVGPTSSGRKGTSFVPVNQLMRKMDFNFWESQCVRGLSSGEGLIQKVSDQQEKNKEGKTTIKAVEKRLFVMEPEFSKVLAQSRREGNILSQILRETYDSGNLAVLSRNPLQADNAHISITGHITPEELKKRLGEIEMANGFGNRFLWFVVRSEKHMPDGLPIPVVTIAKFASRLSRILKTAATQKRLKRDSDATNRWKSIYPELKAEKAGLAGAMLARGESIVLRLSLIYALLDGGNVIRREHLEAALAVWRYNEESVAMLFKQRSGNSLADKLFLLLARGPMMTTEFHSHVGASSSVEIRESLEQLLKTGRITMTKIHKKGAGRPSEQWKRTDA